MYFSLVHFELGCFESPIVVDFFSGQSTVKKMVKRTRTKIIKGSFNCDCQSLLVNLLLAHKLLGNSSLSIARNYCILCSGSLLRCALYFTLYIYTLTS